MLDGETEGSQTPTADLESRKIRPAINAEISALTGCKVVPVPALDDVAALRARKAFRRSSTVFISVSPLGPKGVRFVLDPPAEPGCP